MEPSAQRCIEPLVLPLVLSIGWPEHQIKHKTLMEMHTTSFKF